MSGQFLLGAEIAKDQKYLPKDIVLNSIFCFIMFHLILQWSFKLIFIFRNYLHYAALSGNKDCIEYYLLRLKDSIGESLYKSVDVPIFFF